MLSPQEAPTPQMWFLHWLNSVSLHSPKDPNRFDRDRLFSAVTRGSPEELDGLGDYLKRTCKFLTNSEYTGRIRCVFFLFSHGVCQTIYYLTSRILGLRSHSSLEQKGSTNSFCFVSYKILRPSLLADGKTGKTCLMKALLNLKDGKNETIALLLSIDSQTENPRPLVNAACIDSYYRGKNSWRAVGAGSMAALISAVVP